MEKTSFQSWFNWTLGCAVALGIFYLLVSASESSTARYLGFTKAQVQLLSKADVVILSKIMTDPNRTYDSLGVQKAVPLNPKVHALGLKDYQLEIFHYISTTHSLYNLQDSLELARFIVLTGRSNLIDVLSNHRIRTTSRFYLSGKGLYFEVWMWVWFGVFASILYATTRAVAVKGFEDYRPREFYYTVSKFFYAPFSTIIILLALSLFKEAESFVLFVGPGIIVICFVLGYYSGRTIDLLDRIKNLLFPSTASDDNAPVVDTFKLSGTLLADAAAGPVLTPTELAHAEVVLVDVASGAEVSKQTADAAGAFSFAQLKAGDYLVKTSLQSNGQPYVAEVPVKLVATDVADVKLELKPPTTP